MNHEFNDFGFCSVDEDELEVVQQAQSSAAGSATDATELQNKLDDLYGAITPLLNNLKANPSKEYILWPNRTEKIEQFEKKLFDLYNR